ncbi:hypothetical protein F5Y19DRAFT_158344 [Xylariaceae sp. FL1651]|nr:hypothetical protein F5Y19DRAFT_158344 [Xylariaceae sp. FL1651]
MVLNSFHQFSLLPPEIRRFIYLLASPPRFVHVREDHEDREAFEQRYITTPVQLELHPSIAYFACHWRHRIPWQRSPYRRIYRYHQTTLDAYGFSGQRVKHQPWKSTEATPGIPHHFLSENHSVAWELLRSGSLYSTAPIPVMLHVCNESRQVLIDYGYELAFRTRTHGPQTWFNFNKDVLYVSRFITDWDDQKLHSLLSGNTSWDIGQFDPVDLNRVRRLALGSSGYVAAPDSRESTHEISNILQLFTGVEELFLEECGQSEFEYRFEDQFRRNPNMNMYHKELWCYTPVQEVDVLSRSLDALSQPYDAWLGVASAGYHNNFIKAYKAENMGDGSRFFDDIACKLEERLTKRRDELVCCGLVAPWKIPKISIVHICTPSMCRRLFDWRWRAWNHFQIIKEEESRSKAAEEACRSISIPSKLIYDENDKDNLPPSPFTEKYGDDWEAYQESLWGQDVGYSSYEMECQFWMLEGTVAAPEIR